MVIWLQNDESLDQALTRITKPNIALLKETRIPGKLGRPGNATNNGAYGTSVITPEGLSETEVGARFE